MNERKIARVAQAICQAAGSEHAPDGQCRMCEAGKCGMWQQFYKEAVAALKAAKGF